MSEPRVFSYADVVAEYHSNADYFITGDIGSCNRFILACTRLAAFPNKDAVGGIAGTSTEIPIAEIRLQQEKAEKWLAYRRSGNGLLTRKVSYMGGRGPIW